VTSGFGSSLLYPISSGKQILGDLRGLLWNLGPFPLGVHGYYSHAPFKWAATLPGATAPTTSDVLLQTYGIQGTLEAWHSLVQNIGEVSILVDYGEAWRSLGGNITNSGGAALRSFALGSDKKKFSGQELTFTVQVREVRIGTSIYFFSGDTDGLTGRQATWGISVASPFFTTVTPWPDRLGFLR